MDAQLPVFSGTLKVRACHLFWAKTPVQLTYHRQDYRHALPVVLIRRPGILGGEFRVPLDPCILPVRFLPTSDRMESKLEFALEYGWHIKQVRLRAPDADTYSQWTSLVRAALESGRRPLASCDITAEATKQDLECSSLASTTNSSNATVRRRAIEDELVQQHFEQEFHRRWQIPSEFFVLQHTGYDPYVVQDVCRPSWPIFSSSIAAVENCSFDAHEEILPATTKNRWRWLRARMNICINWSAIAHELFLQTSVFYFLL
ncbi:hypothetical protein PHMEG_00018983 [Phytophthora megakarya]|uniref:PH domain-containing protein n=1 Tax=Phytophthora megakarya TaxID=4795 RepID=A0A225VV99_9STRA|nr:hypothetical protein PHMEG_00018983 [Phytophthora megakarya]